MNEMIGIMVVMGAAALVLGLAFLMRLEESRRLLNARIAAARAGMATVRLIPPAGGRETVLRRRVKVARGLARWWASLGGTAIVVPDREQEEPA